MRTHRITAVTLTALAVTLAACERATMAPDMDELGALFSAAGGSANRVATGTSTGGGAAPNDRGPATGTGGNSGGSVFDVLNARIDGFAGLYRVGMCSVVLMLTDAADVETAVRTAGAVIDPLVARSCPSGVDVAPQRADWDWDELQRFLSLAAPLAGSAGVHSISLDVSLNGLVISVDSGETARRVTASLVNRGIPEGALHFRIRGTGGMSR